MLGDLFESRGITFSRVLSSPLQRAVRTAEIACGGRNAIEIDERLIELDAGPYDGLPISEIPEEMTAFFRDFIHNPAPEGMESLNSIKQRTGELVRSLEREPCGNILLSTHALAMKGVLENLTPGSNGSYWSRYIANCSVYKAEQDENGIGVPYEIYSPER